MSNHVPHDEFMYSIQMKLQQINGAVCNPFMNKQQNDYVSLNVKQMAKSDLDFNHFCKECTIIFHQLHREFLDQLSELKKTVSRFLSIVLKLLLF